jgi:hypothetical protein
MKLTVLARQPFTQGLIIGAKDVVLNQGTSVDLSEYIQKQGSNYASKLGMFSSLTPEKYTFFAIELNLSQGQLGMVEVLVEDLYGSLKEEEQDEHIYEIDLLSGEANIVATTGNTFVPVANWKPVMFELEVDKVETKNHLFRKATLNVSIIKVVPIHQIPEQLPEAFQYIVPEEEEDYSWV